MKAETHTVTEELLLLLARTHFVNPWNFHALTKRYKSTETAYNAIKVAQYNSGGYFGSHTVRFDDTKKNQGSIFFLTQKGAEAAAELVQNECPPVFRPSKDFKIGHADYRHRIKCAHVAARFWQWVDASPDVEPFLWRGYWKKNADCVPLNSVHPEGCKRPMVPDWLIIYDHGEDSVLLSIEVDRTTGCAAMRTRLHNYALALEQGLIQAAVGHAHAPVVCIVSERPNVLRQLVTEVREGKLGSGFLETYRGNFILASSDDIEEKGWDKAFYTLDGERCVLFDRQ